MSHNNSSSPMSKDRALELRRAAANGWTASEIAKEFGHKYQTVYSVINYRSFKHIR